MVVVVVRVRLHLFDVEGSQGCFLGSGAAAQDQLPLLMADTLGPGPN